MASPPVTSDPVDEGSPVGGGSPRAPTLLDALLPIVVLIALLATTIMLFGSGATEGALQAALILGAACASVIAFTTGLTVAGAGGAAVGGGPSAVGAIFI